MYPWKKSIYRAGIAAALLAAPMFAATNFLVTNLVSDQDGVAAITDPNLKGTWGISESATSPFWVSNVAGGTSTLYAVTEAAPAVPTIPNLVVTIPPGSKPLFPIGLPTGQVNNSYGAGNFEVVAGHPGSFIFASLDGTITAWYGGISNNTAAIMVDNGGNAFYTGLGIGVSVSTNTPVLYAANFKGAVDVFDNNFSPISAPGGFVDPNLPAGYYAFNVQRFGRRVYVTFAPSDGVGAIATSFGMGGPGAGVIDVFDTDGNLLQTLVAGDSHLNLPWGMAVTGANFGAFSYALIVGNFGDGTISAYDLNSGAYLGTMQDGQGNNIQIRGLWGLQWGNGGNGGDPGTLYFAASQPTAAGVFHGLFGSIKPMSDSLLQ
ncbi:MAG TPA: TIGR03118 family protein [Bryobacteraceae bacterium]|nr:TIGR03118 family protein [Bryobacteraceae bacterium]